MGSLGQWAAQSPARLVIACVTDVATISIAQIDNCTFWRSPGCVVQLRPRHLACLRSSPFLPSCARTPPTLHSLRPCLSRLLVFVETEQLVFLKCGEARPRGCRVSADKLAAVSPRRGGTWRRLRTRAPRRRPRLTPQHPRLRRRHLRTPSRLPSQNLRRPRSSNHKHQQRVPLLRAHGCRKRRGAAWTRRGRRRRGRRRR